MRPLWDDPLARVALVVLIAATIPAWFIWPGEPAVEAIDAVVIAAFLVVLWVRGFLGADNTAARVGTATMIAGLLCEAVWWAASGNPPLAVELIFPAGIVILVASLLGRRNRPASA